jgi:chromosome segregation ATPase
MAEKKPPDDSLEPEIAQIEQDIKQLISEMSALSSMPESPAIFRQLHSLLMDSHSKNQVLAGLVQKLNAEVVSNATRVASLLEMTEDDGITLQRCRQEYERSWQIASASQASEMAALEQCEALRGEIVRLTGSIHMQPPDDSCIQELRFDIESQLTSSNQRIREMETIRSAIARVQLADQDTRISIDQIAATIQELTNTLSEEDETISKLREFSTSIQTELTDVLADNAESTGVAEQNEIDIPRRQSGIVESRRVILQLDAIQKDYKEESAGSRRGIRSSSKTRDEVVSISERTEWKVRNLTQTISRLEEEADCIKLKAVECRDEFSQSNSELCEWQQRQTNLRHEIELSRMKHHELAEELTRTTHKTCLSEVEVRQMAPDIDARADQLQAAAVQLMEEKAATQSARRYAKLIASGRMKEKGEAQTQQSKVTLLEEELRRYQKQNHEVKMQLSRFTTRMETIDGDMNCAKGKLEQLNGTLRHHDTLIRDMEEERRGVVDQLKVVQEEHSQLETDFAEKYRQAAKLKKDIQQRTQDSILLHFQTRSLERQMTYFEGAADLTQRSLDEVQTAISRFRVEERKLQVIYSQALKDVNHTKAEFSHVEELSGMLHRQLSARQRDVADHALEFAAIVHELEHRAAAFNRQSDELRGLENDLEHGISQYRSLKRRAAVCRAMQLEIVTLENRINREIKIRGHCELQLLRPVNITRWRLLKTMEPEYFRNIQMVQYLKSKLDKAFHQQRSLDAQKAVLLRQLESKNEQMRKVRIEDGEYAISVYRRSISKKEKEMKEIDGDLRDKRRRVFQMESTLDNLKKTITLSHSDSSSMKTRPIGPPTMDRTGIGEGFDMAQIPRRRNPRFAKHDRDEPPQKHPKRTNRDESEDSGKRVRSEYAVTSPPSARKADSVRRKPRVEAKRSKPNGRESIGSSARSSARLSKSRLRFRFQAANNQF